MRKAATDDGLQQRRLEIHHIVSLSLSHPPLGFSLCVQKGCVHYYYYYYYYEYYYYYDVAWYYSAIARHSRPDRARSEQFAMSTRFTRHRRKDGETIPRLDRGGFSKTAARYCSRAVTKLRVPVSSAGERGAARSRTKRNTTANAHTVLLTRDTGDGKARATIHSTDDVSCRTKRET